MASLLSDDQLRDSLKQHGVKVGPIIESTRKVYEKKLDSLNIEEIDLTESRRSPARRVITGHAQSHLRSNKIERTIVTPSDKGMEINSIPQNANIEANDRFIRSRLPLESRNWNINYPFSNLTPSSTNLTPSKIEDQQTFSGLTPFRNLAPDISQKYCDNPRLSGSRRAEDSWTTVLRRSTNTTNNSREDTEGSFDVNSDIYHVRKRSSVPRSNDAGTSTSTSLLFTPPRQSASEVARWSTGQMYPHSSAIFSDDSRDPIFSQSTEFRVRNTCDDAVSVKLLGISIGRHVPNLILLAGVILFIIVASSYLFLKDRHSNVGKIADFQKLVCSPDADASNLRNACISAQNIGTALKFVHVLFDILSRYAGEHICGISRSSSASIEVASAQGLLRHYLITNPTVSSITLEEMTAPIWDSVLLLILHVGRKHLDLVAYSDSQTELNSSNLVSNVMFLQSIRPYTPGKCRLRLWFNFLVDLAIFLLWVILIFGIGISTIYGLYRLQLHRKIMVAKRSTEILQIVQTVIGILQKQLRKHETNPREPSYVPVLTIRELLRREIRNLDTLWPQVEGYVHSNESSICVQEWRGLGETWQWRGVTGWQGSAVVDRAQKLPFDSPPSECLKIRNMFNASMFNSIARKRLKYELLQHILHFGPIFHIGIDSHDNQGLVYLKCASPEVAGNVFVAIHANYFDGSLLHAKFLRSSKYFLRFPEARTAQTALTLKDLE